MTTKPKFTFPKFKKLQLVRTPEGPGKITSIDNTNIGYFYTIGNKIWAEHEIKTGMG